MSEWIQAVRLFLCLVGRYDMAGINRMGPIFAWETARIIHPKGGPQ